MNDNAFYLKAKRTSDIVFDALVEIKQCIDFCENVKKDILANNCSKEIQDFYNKFGVEVESPLVLNTTSAEWIRINYQYIYIYIYCNYKDGKLTPTGNVTYELDYEGYYGTELIRESSYNKFLNKMINDTDVLFMIIKKHLSLND